MNILIVTPYFPPQTGGVATYLDSVQRFLRQRGHTVHILLPGPSHEITRRPSVTEASEYEFYMRIPLIRGVMVKSILAFSLFYSATITRLNRFLEDKAIDLILLEYPLPYMFYFTRVERRKKMKVIIGVHGDDILSLHLAPKHEQWLVNHLIRHADWVLAHSASLLSRVKTPAFPCSSTRSYLPCGVDTDLLRELAQHCGGRFSQLKNPYVLTVAKLYERKGLDVLLHAIRQLGPVAQAYHFIIAGDGPEEHSLKQLAANLGIQKQVIFTGEVQKPEIARLLRNCEFFVLPSRSEPFGIALLEAMSFGKAIIATKVGGIPEFVIDGHNGLLVPSEDSTTLAKHLERMMQDGALRARIGKNGLRMVSEKYDYGVLIEQYEQLFNQVLARSSSGTV